MVAFNIAEINADTLMIKYFPVTVAYHHDVF